MVTANSAIAEARPKDWMNTTVSYSSQIGRKGKAYVASKIRGLLVHELDDTGEYDVAIGSGNSINDASAEQVTRGLETVVARDDELLTGVVLVVLELLDLLRRWRRRGTKGLWDIMSRDASVLGYVRRTILLGVRRTILLGGEYVKDVCSLHIWCCLCKAKGADYKLWLFLTLKRVRGVRWRLREGY